MIEIKFIGQASNGQQVSGTTVGSNPAEIKKKLAELTTKKNIQNIKKEKKRTFIFKAKKGNEKPISGEQRAFNKKEVEDALTRLGYTVISINPKLFDFQLKPPTADIVTFVKISAELLEQKLAYQEILTLLINDTQNPALKTALKEINNELKKGADSQQTFLRFQHIFGKFAAYMLGLASKSGNMVEIYKATAKFLERRQEFRKNLKSALITPLVTLFVLFLAVLFYVGYIFPETARLFVRFGVELPPMTAATLKISDFLVENPYLIVALILGPPIAIIQFGRIKKGRYLLDKWMLKIPIIGSLIHKTLIEVFCRVFYTLYSGSAESIEPIRIAAEATGNAYFEDRIKNVAIPLMIKKGVGVTDAFESSGVFTETAIARFHSGEESGTIKNTSLQLANYYETETVFRLKNIIEIIQVAIAMIIMVVMIALTIVSAETATVRPQTPTMGNLITKVSDLV